MDNTNSLKRGQVVKSKNGRDSQKIFVIIEVIDKDYLLIVNGKNRKLERPKKKKVKHLIIFNSYINLEIENLNNSYIRKKLEAFN